MSEDMKVDSDQKDFSIQEQFIHGALGLNQSETEKLESLLIIFPELEKDSTENKIVNTSLMNAYTDDLTVSFWRPIIYYQNHPNHRAPHRDNLYKNFNKKTSSQVKLLEEKGRINSWQDFTSALIISSFKDKELKSKLLNNITGKDNKTALETLKSFLKNQEELE